MKRMILLCLALSPLATAQPPAARHHMQAGSKVYIEPMNGFETYLSAAILKKNVPLTVVSDQARADYIIGGTSTSKEAGWAKTVFISGASHSSASITVKDAKSGDLVFAYAVDKFNSKRANQSTAEACAKHMKEDIEKASKW